MIAAIALAMGFAGTAMSQQAPAALGTVQSLSGTVIVVRGGQTYSLAAGDQIFPGDRILTRTGANVILNVPGATGCSKPLTSAQAIVVDAALCTKTAIALGTQELNELAGLGGTGGGIGATPALFALLGVGGAAAAANNNGTSASP